MKSRGKVLAFCIFVLSGVGSAAFYCLQLYATAVWSGVYSSAILHSCAKAKRNAVPSNAQLRSPP